MTQSFAGGMEMRETNCNDDQQQRFVMPLDVTTIDQLFQNVERVECERCESYRVRDQYGNDAGVINYLGKNEWRVFVDNFPSHKKYFAWNLPVKTVGEFIADIQRTGLELVVAQHND